MKKYREFLKECRAIAEYYENLVTLTKNHNYVGSTNEWIIDNYYLVVETKNFVRKNFKERKHLNRILDENTEIYDVLVKIFERHKFSLDLSLLIRELNNYQTKNDCYFTYRTISIIPIVLAMIIIDKLYSLCQYKEEKQKDILAVSQLMRQIDEKRLKDENINLSEFITIDEKIIEHPVYLYHLNASLKELGEMSNDIFQQLNQLLEKKHVDLKQIINDEHLASIADNMLVSSLFSNLKNIAKIEESSLIDRVSKTEKLLRQDAIYKGMTLETKELYRTAITKKIKKTKEDEYQYVERIMKEVEKTGKHVGFFLLHEKNLKLRSFIYIASIALSTIILSGILSRFLLGNHIVAFILLLAPMSEVTMQIINKIMMHIYPAKVLPKMNFENGIPKDCATIIVIPTILKDVKKTRKMFDTLEKYYLSNQSSNLYFALLGDAMEYHKQDYEYDEDIKEEGLRLSEKLNNKYKKKIFYFMYRKRAYNPHEGKYLGYERKRGALSHFNKLLLGNLSASDKEKYVYAENVSSLQGKIKYVITLDQDTELILNSAQKLVGLMAHPLNKPVLNHNKTKVIRGYGVVQPRVSLDIEATNESVYSQLIAGIGGFDVYSSLVPNFYQDVFNEGSFVGKGIYDLSVFDTVFSNTLPENLILSHDLLEGNYVRCGYASDIELIDGFPAEFLIDTSRQHRWARGDVQIIGWLKRKVKNKAGHVVDNPLNAIEKYKIFDNIRRIFVNPSLLLLLLIPLLDCNQTTTIITILSVILIVSLPILFYLKDLLKIQKRKLFSFRHYDNLIFGGVALVTRIFINIITIPYYSYLYLSAMFTSLYRMFISHKNLLNWITAEDAQKTINGNLTTYLKAFKMNYITAIILMFCVAIQSPVNKIAAIILIVIFLLAPFILWKVSVHNKYKVEELEDDEKEQLQEMAYRTWLYFDTLITEENNYLVADNYQINREFKEDTKTSPTDIGMSLMSIVSAYELHFIDRSKAATMIDGIVQTIEKLEKWNGHLFNWYNIKTMEKMTPFEVSSVDSGNLAACFIVVKEFLKKIGKKDLEERVDSLFEAMDFSKFYTDSDVFSIGYNVTEEKLSPYNYNKFASESRILSFVAIAKGDVPSKHWLSLDKSLIKYKKYKGLTSWSGTSFEYFMPYIFMKTYPNTLLDESYFFAEYCQRSYMEEVDKSMPWGISESAYDELDDGLNYRYKAFSTPYLKVQEEKNQRIVLSPYASCLVLPRDPQSVYKNLRKFKKMDMYGDFGFYESYDYDHKENVLAYFAHHQGMILSSITNYLKKGVLQNYFHQDVRVQAIEILLKEKVQLNPVIDLKIFGYKKYNYDREKVENDFRELHYVSDIPEVSALSNSHYLTLINDRGNGFSRYETIQLNRYRKITEQDYGMFLYIKDLDNGNVWSNTYSPMNVVPEKYNVVFASDRAKFSRYDNEITTKTEIIVVNDENLEIRKVSFTNRRKETANLELTTYMEAIISKNIDDISHRTFRNLFISSEFDPEFNAVIMCRKNASQKQIVYIMNRLFIEDNDHEVTFETERAKFLGRNHNTDNPIALTKRRLSNTQGANIDPIISIRNTISVAPNTTKTVYFMNGFAKSKTQIDKIIREFNSSEKIEESFQATAVANTVNTKHLGLEGHEMRLYNIMLNYLYQTSRYFTTQERKDLLAKNAMNQTNLWKFGISGDYPIVLVDIKESESLNLAKEVIKAYEYYKSRALHIDVVIINGEKDQYKAIIKREIEKEKYRMNTLYDFMGTPGQIFVIDSNDLNEQEITLLNMVARLKFDASKNPSLEESVKEIQKENKMTTYDKIQNQKEEPYQYHKNDLKFFNEFGAFTSNGKEYLVIDPNTPTPWSNVVANPKFGTIMTNNNCGFTYAYNSQQFKVTSWTNDIVLNDKSEGIKINDKIVDCSAVRHGFGYSIFYHNNKEYDLTTTQFVAKEDTIKFYSAILTNKTKEKQTYKITYWINPTFGPNEEKSSRYILGNYFQDMNAVLLRNVYNIDFSHITAFLSSTVPISSYEISKILFKSIDIELTLEPNESKKFAFLLGTEIGNENVEALIEKYNTLEKIDAEYENVKNYWINNLENIQVKTPDESFNYMLNGWYLYQSMASRIMAKAGFYQVGGAFGFRDQLQDAMNICIVHPELTKKQILINARHQFREGDVLHWWHEENHIGLRSRYKDDYLWLIYAVSEYTRITGDYDILQERTGFVFGQMLDDDEAERGINYNYTEDDATIYDHCLLAINKSLNSIGKNGLPLIGGGDWSDGLNRVGIQGKGTSVWLGFFLYMMLERFITLTKKYNKNASIDKYQKVMERLQKSLNTVAWEKESYLRGFFDNGDKLGSMSDKECKIDLLPQSFSILSKVIEPENIEKVLHSVEDNLVDQKLKIIKLFTPPFENSKNNPGYIMDYPKGVRENGGQYTHATSWYIMALIKLGYYDRAYQYYQMINPINRTKTKEDVLTYQVEPYVIAADIYSNELNPGRGGWTWYTGSAGWYYNIGITEMLGLKKEGNHLKIEPHVTSTWDSYEIEYKYCDTTYKIKVNLNASGDSIVMDGEKITKDYITLRNDKRLHAIIVNISKKV